MEIRELIHFILGSLVATGSSDTSIKLIDVEKMKTFSQTKDQGNDEFSAARPVTRTFYDHTQVPFLFITPKKKKKKKKKKQRCRPRSFVTRTVGCPRFGFSSVFAYPGVMLKGLHYQVL